MTNKNIQFNVPTKSEYIKLMPKKDILEDLIEILRPYVYEEIGIELRKKASYGNYYTNIQFKDFYPRELENGYDFHIKLIRKIITNTNIQIERIELQRIKLLNTLVEITKQFLVDFKDDYTLDEFINASMAHDYLVEFNIKVNDFI